MDSTQIIYYPGGTQIPPSVSMHHHVIHEQPKVISEKMMQQQQQQSDSNTKESTTISGQQLSSENQSLAELAGGGGGGENDTENHTKNKITAGGLDSASTIPDDAQLVSRTTQQVKTQQVKTVTKVYTTREVRHHAPDGQLIEPGNNGQQSPSLAESINNNNHLHHQEHNNHLNEYTNFPGPKSSSNEALLSNTSQSQRSQGSVANTNTTSVLTNFDYNNFDPNYSNTNFANLMQQQQTMASSPSPNSGSTANTGSTIPASSYVTSNLRLTQQQQQPYDPYARNNQIGYHPHPQDYSNFNNYQDLTHMPDPASSSPQTLLRRHQLDQLANANVAGSEAAYGQTSGPPGSVYAFVPGMIPTSTAIQFSTMVPPNQGQMHSPGNVAIYGNFEEIPHGYLDRRQTYDENGTYGQMMARRNPPPPPMAIFDDPDAAYQHFQHSLQQQAAAGLLDPQQEAMFFQNGGILGGPLGPLSTGNSGVMGAPGSSAVTAIGPDGVRWRDPDLHEVIEFLSHPNSIVRANAAAYLQHLCFMDDSMKAKTRALGGIPALINLLSQDVSEIQRNSCGALRNLSYGRQNDENKRAIRNAEGIPSLVRLLRKTPDNEIRELVTSVLWNLSSCEDLKRQIIDDALQVLVSTVIIPHSGWDRNYPGQQHSQSIYWSTVFRNASGVFRNISSAGEYARRKLRECEGLVDSLLFLVRAAIGKNDMDNKSVENCVCILRNLSYRCQEVIDPEYDKHPPGSAMTGNVVGSNQIANNSTVASSYSSTSAASPSSTLSPSSSSSSKNSTSSLMGGLSSKVGENLGCFGGSRKKSSSHHSKHHDNSLANAISPSTSVSGLESKTASLSLNSTNGQRDGAPKGMELLWQTDVVQPYLALLSECSNPETLEAAAGAIQNLAACYWQPSIDIRGAVRKEKGLPILVELLRMEVDRVVCAVATALRNLAMDNRNKELIGKYALKDLVSKLPAPSGTGIPLETGTSDDTVAAVLATLNEVISKNPDFAKSLLEASGMQRLTLIIKHRNRFSSRVVKFTSQLLYNMWQHTELRDVYRKAGWKESHFVVSTNLVSSATLRSSSVGARANGPGGGVMTPSQSQSMMMAMTPTANGTLSSGSLYQSISANNTLSRPMSTVGGTKYEDHAQFRTLPRSGQQQQMVAQRMRDEMAMSDMIDGHRHHQSMTNGGTLVRPPIGGIPIFPPGTLHREPVYAQVNRERKRQQQQQQIAAQGPPVPPNHPSSSLSLTSPDNRQQSPTSISSSNYQLMDPTVNEPIYPPSMPAGDSWV